MDSPMAGLWQCQCRTRTVEGDALTPIYLVFSSSSAFPSCDREDDEDEKGFEKKKKKKELA